MRAAAKPRRESPSMSAASNINTPIAGARHSADDRVQPGEVAVKAAAGRGALHQ
jgi:hypothetical protein